MEPGISFFGKIKDRKLLLGFGLWCIAVLLAFGAQYLLRPLNFIAAGYVFYGLAAILGIIGISIIDSRDSTNQPIPKIDYEKKILNKRTALFRFAVGFWAAGLIASSIAVYAQVENLYRLSFGSWLSALLFLGIGSFIFDFQRGKVQFFRNVKLAEFLGIIFIIIVSVALRLPHLENIPPNVHGDEAEIGNDARNILNGGAQNIFGVGWAAHSEIVYGISAVFMKLFGDNLFGLRLAAFFLGSISILMMYLLTKRFFNARVAFLAAFLLGVSQWHIHFSRTGFIYISAAFASAALFYFLVKGIEKNTALDFLLAGFMAGLCLCLYLGARLIFVPLAIYLIYCAIWKRALAKRWAGIAVMFFGVLIFMAPMIPLFLHEPSLFLARGGVFIFNRPILEHVYSTHKIDTLSAALRIQSVNTLQAFNLHGDTSLQYGSRTPLLDFLTGALFVLGLAYATFRFYRPRYFLFVVWFWSVLILGSMLTVDAMFAPRVSAMIPVVFIFPAIVIDAGWRAASTLLAKKGKLFFGIMVCLFLLLALHANYTDYFNSYVGNKPADYSTTMSRYVAAVNDEYRVYSMGTPGSSLKYSTARFLIPDVDGVDVQAQNLTLPLDSIPYERGVIFLIQYGLPYSKQRLVDLQANYPEGNLALHADSLNRTLFYSYAVENDELIAVYPDAKTD